ncbi:MAG: nucleotide modification associated domain-containing protein [Candidatus Aenigmatarchaeota archaeon]
MEEKRKYEVWKENYLNEVRLETIVFGNINTEIKKKVITKEKLISAFQKDIDGIKREFNSEIQNKNKNRSMLIKALGLQLIKDALIFLITTDKSLSKLNKNKEISHFISPQGLIFNECIDIALAKNKDYGSDNILRFGTIGLLVRLNDKISRLINLMKTKNIEVKDEKLKDTAEDLINYSIYLIMLSENVWY